MRRLFSFLTLFVLLPAAPAVAQERPPEKRRVAVKVPSGFELGSARTVDDTAKAGEGDYDPIVAQQLGPLPPSTIDVEINDDGTPERDETFLVRFSRVGRESVDVRVTITDDDPPSLELGGAQAVAEDEPGAVFSIVNPTPVDRPVSVAYSAASGTATAGSDFEPRAARVTIQPGQRFALFGTPYLADAVDEPDETFTLNVSDPQGATLTSGKTAATGTIVNDDLSALSVTDGSAREGDDENAVTRVAVTLSAPTFRTVTVQYATLDGAARAPIDYLARLGTLTFAPGQTEQVVDLAVVDDERSEGTEFFGVELGKAQGATVRRGSAVVALQDDDDPNTDDTPPAMRLTKPKLKGRSISVRVTCPKTETRCQGRLTLFSVADRRANSRSLRRERRLGRKSYTLRGGQAKTLKMTLSKTVVAAARASGRLRVRAFALTSDSSDNVDTTVKPATLKFRRTSRASASR